MIPEHIIDDLKRRLDAREVLAQDLGAPANASGGWWAWQCPWPDHQDNTPSFKATRDGWKCFGVCGRSGDILDWRQQWHGESFTEAFKALNGGEPYQMPQDPQKAAEMAAQRAQQAERALQAEIHKAQAALAELREAQSWLRYYEALTADSRQLWSQRGIPDAWQDFWQLGWCADYPLYKKDNGSWVRYWSTPSLVMPVRGYDWQVNNVKHRLLEPPTSGDRYRQEIRHVPAAPFICLPERSTGPLLIIEGEIKAMVVFLTLDNDQIQVAGLPAVSPGSEVFDVFEGHDPVWICLDPDAYHRPRPEQPAPIEQALAALGPARARVIKIPKKIDDAIVAGALDRYGLQSLMRMAR